MHWRKTMNIPDSDIPTIRAALRDSYNWNLNNARLEHGEMRDHYKKVAGKFKAVIDRLKGFAETCPNATFAKPRITIMQNEPKSKSKKTNSMGADHDKLTEALRRRGLLMPARGQKSKEAKRISRRAVQDCDE